MELKQFNTAKLIFSVTALDIPLLILTALMVTFLWRARRTDNVLRSGFFTLFILVSVADCTHVLIVSEPHNSATRPGTFFKADMGRKTEGLGAL